MSKSTLVAPRFADTDAIGWENTDAIGWDQAVDLTSPHIIGAWLFNIDDESYLWSTQSITIDSDSYAAMVDPKSFGGIKIANSYNGAERIHVLEDIDIEIPDPDGTYSSANFIGKSVDIGLYVDDGETGYVIRTFLYSVKSAKKIYDILYLTLQDRFVSDELEDFYPNTDLVQNIWASDGDSQLGYCLPVPFGTAYIPMPSVYIDDQRYYVLGEDSGTYTIEEVRSPQSWPESVWTSTNFSFSQSTKDTHKVFQATIVDSDEDGTADNNGLFRDGNQFAPISTKYSNSNTSSTTNPAEIIADMIFSGSSIPVASNTFGLTEIVFNVAFPYRRKKYEWAAKVLKASHSALKLADNGSREVKSLVSTPKATFSASTNILEESFAYSRVLNQEDYDGGHIKFPKSGEPQHVLYEYRVGLGNSATTNPIDETLDLQFIQDSEVAQKVGILYFERVVKKKAEASFDAWVDAVIRNPDEVVLVSGDLYEGGTAYEVVIDNISISSDLTVSLNCTEFE